MSIESTVMSVVALILTIPLLTGTYALAQMTRFVFKTVSLRKPNSDGLWSARYYWNPFNVLIMKNELTSAGLEARSSVIRYLRLFLLSLLSFALFFILLIIISSTLE